MTSEIKTVIESIGQPFKDVPVFAAPKKLSNAMAIIYGYDLKTKYFVGYSRIFLLWKNKAKQ